MPSLPGVFESCAAIHSSDHSKDPGLCGFPIARSAVVPVASDLTRWEVGNTEFGGKLVRLELKDSVVQTDVEGPANPTQKNFTRVSIPLRLELDRERNRVKILLQGQEESVPERQWSRWFDFTFRINAFLKIHGVGRFYILETFPELKVYLCPINFDPRNPPVPLSYPKNFSAQLAKVVAHVEGWYDWRRDVQGVFLLLVYALGLGVPFLLVGLLIDRAGPIVRRVSRYVGPISVAGGVILALTGVLILSGRLAQLANYAPLY